MSELEVYETRPTLYRSSEQWEMVRLRGSAHIAMPEVPHD
jgi:hypothetical protein